MGERIVSPTPESASPLSHQASAGKSERAAAGEEKRRRGKGRRKFPARFQQASREMGVLPFMGAVPVSRNPASRELWDNPEFPPDHQAVPASDKPEAPVHPAHVLPMNHQGQFTLASSSSGRGKKSEMDMPHNGVMPPASPSRLDDSIATASSGWFLTPDSSPAARGAQNQHPVDHTTTADSVEDAEPAVLETGAVTGRGQVEDVPDSPRPVVSAGRPQPQPQPQRDVADAADDGVGSVGAESVLPEWVLNQQRAYANKQRAEGYGSVSSSAAVGAGASLDMLVSSFRGGMKTRGEHAHANTENAPTERPLLQSGAATTVTAPKTGADGDSVYQVVADAGTANTVAHEKGTQVTPPLRRRSLEPQALLNAYRQAQEGDNDGGSELGAGTATSTGVGAAPSTTATTPTGAPQLYGSASADASGVRSASTAEVSSGTVASLPLDSPGEALKVGHWIEKRSALYDKPYWEHTVSRQQTWSKPPELERAGDSQGQQQPRPEASKSSHLWDSIADSSDNALYTTADTSVDSNLSLTSEDEDEDETEPAATAATTRSSLATALRAEGSLTPASNNSPSLPSIDELSVTGSSSQSGSGGSGSDLGVGNHRIISWTPPGPPPSLQSAVPPSRSNPPPRTESADRRLVST